VAALLDTGFLLAVLAENDPQHAECLTALGQEPHVMLTDVVLPELAYLVLRNMDHHTLARFLRSVGAGQVDYLSSTPADLTRAADLLEEYADNRVDFVDCVLVAIAERMNITRMLTIDRRHFSILRPKHCDYFEILP
jgi:predicted nucleic acid-binding protein